MLLLFHPAWRLSSVTPVESARIRLQATYASKVFLPALQELDRVFRSVQLPVSVAALDLTASPAPPESFLREYPSAVAPHLQLILPRSMDGEAGVVDYDGMWSSRALSTAACRLAGPAAEIPELKPEQASRFQRWFGRQDRAARECRRQQVVKEVEQSIDIYSAATDVQGKCELSQG
eukprot:g27857.t1